MPPAVVPPKLVDETFVALVDDMLRYLVRENVSTSTTVSVINVALHDHTRDTAGPAPASR
jgi:hypothetical protein